MPITGGRSCSRPTIPNRMGAGLPALRQASRSWRCSPSARSLAPPARTRMAGAVIMAGPVAISMAGTNTISMAGTNTISTAGTNAGTAARPHPPPVVYGPRYGGYDGYDRAYHPAAGCLWPRHRDQPARCDHRYSLISTARMANSSGHSGSWQLAAVRRWFAPPPLSIRQCLGAIPPGMGAAALTVCICSHNRPEDVRLCLDGLRAQTVPSERFDVLVIDSASGPEAVAALRQCVAGFAPARLLRLEQPGLKSCAQPRRSRGARALHRLSGR